MEGLASHGFFIGAQTDTRKLIWYVWMIILEQKILGGGYNARKQMGQIVSFPKRAKMDENPWKPPTRWATSSCK